MTTTRTAATTQAKIVTTPLITITEVDTLAARYLDIKEQIELLETEKKAISQLAEGMMQNGVLVTSHGSFKAVTRRSYSWSLDTVKAAMGRTWTSFVQPDTKLLKTRMETKDTIGCQLEVLASVAESSVVTFFAK